MGAERWDEQVGSVADEATRLLESLRRSAAEAAADPPADDVRPEATGSARADAPGGTAGGADMPDAADGAAPDGAAHDPFCTWCPLCRGAAVVRSLSPETLARLADLASLAATVLTDLAASRPGAGTPASGADPAGASTGPDDAPGRAAARPPARARRTSPAPSRPIPVSDADDPQEAPRG